MYPEVCEDGRFHVKFLQQQLQKQKTATTKRHKEAFGGDGDVYYLDCGLFSQVLAYVQTHQIVYVKYVQFLFINYTSVKAV